LLNQGNHLGNPWQAVVHAHRSAHEHKAGESVYAYRNGIALVDANQAVGESAAVEIVGEIPGAFVSGVTKNQNFFHPMILTSVLQIRNIVASSALVLMFAAHPVEAVEKISLHALFKDKAILLIDGARRVLKAGDTSPEGVKLISTDTQAETAAVEVDGKRKELGLGVVMSAMVSSKSSVVLYPDGGHFFADGQINGVSVRFMVDTGASTVAMSTSTAKRIGLDVKKSGRQGYSNTAGGVVPVYSIKLDRVQVGEIMIYNVDGTVMDGMSPGFVLLGMSFLGQLDMKRDSLKMELMQR
jgi:aspartyl protease family protein